MKQKLFSVFTSTGMSTSATEYRTLGRGTGNASETARYHVVPRDGTFRNLRISIASALTSGSWVVGLYVDGSLSALKLTVSNAATTYSTTTEDVDVTAGQRVCIQCVPTSPNAAKTARISVEYESSTSNTTMVGCASGAVAIPAATSYIPPYSPGNEANEAPVYAVVPCAGTISRLYAYLETVPGGTYTRTFALCVNGSTVSAPTVTYTAAENGLKSDTATAALAVAAGDTLSIKATVSNASAATSVAQFGFVFSPTTDGQFIIPYAGNYGNNLSTSAARYMTLVGAYVAFQTAYLFCDNILGYSDYQIVGVRGLLTGTPGEGKQYAFDLREDDANSSPQLQMVIADTATTGSASATFTPADYSGLQWMSTPTGTPTARQIILSYIGYIEPTGGATPINVSDIADDANAL